MLTTCSQCGRSLDVSETDAARLPACPACGGRLTAANPYAASAVAAEPAPSPGMPSMADLQWVASYRKLIKQLRASGGGSIFFGLLAIGIWVAFLGANPLNVLLILLGLLLIGEGIWLMVAPSPAGLIVHGIALILIGLWNVGIAALNMAAGGKPNVKIGVLGVFQFVWAVQSFGQFKKLQDAQRTRPSPATLKALDTLVKGMQKGTMETDATLVQFQAGVIWKARLAGDTAVFVNAAGDDLVFAHRDQVNFEDTGKALIGSQRKVKFQFADRALSGTMTPQALDRYRLWKDSGLAEVTDAEVI